MELYKRDANSVLISIDHYNQLLQRVARKRKSPGLKRHAFYEIKNEKWKVLADTNGRYRISDLGRVHDVQKNIICSQVLGSVQSPHLYMRLMFVYGERSKLIKDLVYETFVGKKGKLKVVGHKDGDVNNNILTNLMLRDRLPPAKVTRTKTKKYLSVQGVWKVRPSMISDTDVEEIKRLRAQGMYHQDIATKFGVTQNLISRIVNGRDKRFVQQLST